MTGREELLLRKRQEVGALALDTGAADARERDYMPRKPNATLRWRKLKPNQPPKDILERTAYKRGWAARLTAGVAYLTLSKRA